MKQNDKRINKLYFEGMIIHQIPPLGYFPDKDDRPKFKDFLVVREDKLLEGKMRILLPDTLVPELYLVKFIYRDFTFGFEVSLYPNHIKYLLFVFLGLISVMIIWDFPPLIPNIQHWCQIIASIIGGFLLLFWLLERSHHIC